MGFLRLFKGPFLGIALALLIFFFAGAALEPLEDNLYDLRMCLRDAPAPDSRILIVAIDRNSQDALGAMPWDRSYHARVIRNLTRAGARVVAMDIFFSDPSASGAADRLLADSMRANGNVVLPLENRPYGESKKEGFSGQQFLHPIQMIGTAAAGVGFVAIPLESNRAIRRCHLVQDLADGSYRFLALEALGRCLGLPPERMVHDQRHVRWSSLEVPLDNGTFPITYHGLRGTYETVSYLDVLAMYSPPDPLPAGLKLPEGTIKIAPETIKGRLVFIGSVVDLKDRFLTPVSGLARSEDEADMPGVEIQANVADSLWNRQFVRHLPWAGNLAVILIVGAVLGTLAWLEPMGWSIGLMAFTGILGFIFGLLNFRYRGVMADMAGPLALAGAIFTLGIVRHFWLSRQEQRRLRVLNQMMETVARDAMDPEIYRVMVEQHRPPQELAARRHGSVLFTDVAGYTELSELNDIGAVANQLTELFDASEKIVSQHGGRAVKLLGDAQIMLFRESGENDVPERRAVEAALELEKLFQEMERQWVEKDMIPMRSGIGVASGEVWLGMMGSAGKGRYDILGSPVNRAARVQDFSKHSADRRVVVDGETAAKLGADFIQVERVANLKGLGELTVYEVLGTEGG